MKTYLNVPYEERHEARRLGAIWDLARRRWFVENKGNLRPFLKWMEDHLKKPTKSIAFSKTYVEPKKPKRGRRKGARSKHKRST